MATQAELKLNQGLLEALSHKKHVITEEQLLKPYSTVKWAPEFIKDNSNQILLMGGRRGAKTTTTSAKIGWFNLFFKPHMKEPAIFYASKTFEHAMGLMWKKLKYFKDYFGIGDWNMKRESAGVIQTPRGDIRVLGFNDVDAIGKALGQPFKLFIVDESQEIKSKILQYIIRDCGSWGTLDAKGTVVMLGNPPRDKYHFFAQEWLAGNCKKYHTNIYKNPYFNSKDTEEWIDQERKIRGEIKGKESPEFRRMHFGECIFESSQNIFTITDDNYYEHAPLDLETIVSVDIGWKGHDACVVLGFNRKLGDDFGNIYLLEEYYNKRQSMELLVQQADALAEKYKSSTIIADTSGLAQGGVETLIQRYSRRSWMLEKKKDKLAWIKLLQTEITHNRFKFKKDAQFLKEIPLIEWSEKHEKINDDMYHSYLLDAILYGNSYCNNYIAPPKKRVNRLAGWDEAKIRMAFPNETTKLWDGSDSWQQSPYRLNTF